MNDGSPPSLGADTELTLLAAGLLFLAALVLGVVKYGQMARSSDHLAHPYIDTAHRAALLYSFATLLVAAFVELSAWPAAVNLACAATLLFFFVASIASYAYHGLARDTVNQFERAGAGLHAFMVVLIAAEIGAFGVLLAGFARTLTS